MCRKRRCTRKQRGGGKAKALARRGFVKLFGVPGSSESLKAQFARRHALPLLAKNRKLRRGKTIGGVKFRISRNGIIGSKRISTPFGGITINKRVF